MGRYFGATTMLRSCLLAAAALVLCVPALGDEEGKDDDQGTISLFNGKNLDGWDGDPRFWSVQNGAIVGQTTPENPTDHNTFLIWRGGTVEDFVLTLEYKILAHNSGIQYRSRVVPGTKWVMTGHQADMTAAPTYSGIHYEEKGRGILALRGQKKVVQDNGKPKLVEQFGDAKKLQSYIHDKGWNTYKIIADDQTFTHIINGHVMSIVIDKDDDKMVEEGLIGLQLHAGQPMKVMYRNLQLRRLDDEKKTSQSDAKSILFIAGGPSHAYGAHEHRAGCLLLAKALAESGLPVKTKVVTNGWPEDESVFEDVDAVVIYADGGPGNPAAQHLDKFRELAKQGVGIVCLHYAVEVPKGKAGHAFLDAIGGYFEPNWSVNPTWTAQFDALPEHPITRGVEPFQIHDEWYYHMRFCNGMQGVTPILTDLPPATSLSRPDGPHSGNPAVRKAVASGTPQHVAWAYQRKNGGRGFGFTGGHFHWNWGNDEFRQLVLNAIVWGAHLGVPAEGVPAGTVTVSELEANQDSEPPAGYNPARIQALLDEWND